MSGATGVDAAARPAPAASKSLLTGAGTLAAGRYAVAALGWIGSAVIARQLTGPEYGAFTTVFSLLGLVGLLSELRMSRLVLAALDRADDAEAGRLVGSYVALRTVVGVAGYAAALGVVAVAGYPREVLRATALAGTVLVVMSAWYAVVLLFQARMWHRGVALSQLAGQVVQLAVTVAIAAAGVGSTVWFAFPPVLSALVAMAWILAALRGVVRLRLRVEPERWWAWLKEAAPLSLGYALETVYFRIDVVMLSLMSATLTPVGLYGIGYKFSDLVGSLPVALLGPALALLVAAGDDAARFHRTLRTTIVVLAAVGVGVGVAFAVFAEDAIRVLYGSRYTPGAHAARLLVAGQVLHFFTSLCFTVLVAVGRNRLYPLAALTGVAVNVLLNLVLIPAFSYRGSAAATIATEIVVLGLLAGGVARLPAARPWPAAALARVAAAGAGLTGVLLALRPFVPWPVAAAIAPACYLGLLHVLRVDGPGGLRALARGARLDMLGAGGGAPPVEAPRVAGGATGRPPAPRIVAVSATSLVSGAEIVLLRLLEAATRAGWDVACACPDGPLASRLGARGITRIRVPELRLPSGPRLVGSAVVLARSVRVAGRIRRATRDADVVLANGLHSLVALRLARLRAPVTWLVHDVIVRRDRLAFLRLGAPAVDLAIAVSEAAAAPLRRRRLRTVVIRNGTPWPVPAAEAERATVVVGCNAVLTPWKGQDVLLEAVARLGRRDVVVELLGATLPKDGRYAAALRARAERPDLAGRVRFLGHVDEPLAVMRSWTVAACPSVDPEAVSLGVLESMSVGVPVVGTDHGGIPEFLGDAGLLVRPGDAADLAAALGRLLDDRDLWARCAAAGPAAVAHHLTLDQQEGHLLDTLADLAARARRLRHEGLVVFAVPDFEPTLGGTTRQADNQARALLARGYDVTIVTQRLDPRWPPSERAMGLRIRRLRPAGRDGLRMKLLVLSLAWWLRRRRRQIRVVHVLMYPDFAVAAALAGLADRTVMCWAGVGDATDTLLPSANPFRRVVERGRRRALAPTAQVALTPALRDELAGLGFRDVTVVPTPVDTARFRPPTPAERKAARGALGVADGEFAVVYTGHLRALKRVEHLVDAFAGLVASGFPGRLFLVGGSRDDLEDRTDALRGQVAGLGVADLVTFAGAVPCVEQYLHAADVVVLPSDREGLPNSILEALACGVPVVAPPSAAGDQVLDGTCGIVPPSNHPVHLREALARLAADPDLRASLSAGARRAARRYALPEVVDAYEALYARLAPEPGDDGPAQEPGTTAAATRNPRAERAPGASP